MGRRLGCTKSAIFQTGTNGPSGTEKYRDTCRRFIKGTDDQKKDFADSLLGSSRLYERNNRKPFHSINFIRRDGFTLNDAVSYQFKHNNDNGENGNDGANDNESWNCGQEGETGDENVNNLRARQMKNFMLALFVSQGTPMLLMGDEYGHTRFGNNNTYGHDDRRNNFSVDGNGEIQRYSVPILFEYD